MGNKNCKQPTQSKSNQSKKTNTKQSNDVDVLYEQIMKLKGLPPPNQTISVNGRTLPFYDKEEWENIVRQRYADEESEFWISVLKDDKKTRYRIGYGNHDHDCCANCPCIQELIDAQEAQRLNQENDGKNEDRHNLLDLGDFSIEVIPLKNKLPNKVMIGGKKEEEEEENEDLFDDDNDDEKIGGEEEDEEEDENDKFDDNDEDEIGGALEVTTDSLKAVMKRIMGGSDDEEDSSDEEDNSDEEDQFSEDMRKFMGEQSRVKNEEVDEVMRMASMDSDSDQNRVPSDRNSYLASKNLKIVNPKYPK